MKKNKTFFAKIMTMIGVISTAIVAYLLWKECKKEECPVKKLLRFFQQEDDIDWESYDESLEEEEMDSEEESEEDPVDEIEDEMEEETPAPKARRGYFSLKFPAQ